MSTFYVESAKSPRTPDYIDQDYDDRTSTTLGGYCTSNEDVMEQVEEFVESMTHMDADFSEYEDLFVCVHGRYLMSSESGNVVEGYNWFSKL